MYTFTATLLVVFSCALAVFAEGGLEINTPSAVSTCTDVNVTWSGANAPFDLVVLDASDPCGATLMDLTITNKTTYTWKAPTLKAGQKIIFSLMDKADQEVWSNTVTVGTGKDTSCIASSSVVDAPRASVTAVVSPTGSSSTSGSGTIPGNVPVNPEGGLASAAVPRTSSSSALVLLALGLVSYVAL